jgi:excisionase family DNA binding protein
MKSEMLESRNTAPPELFTASQFAHFCHVDLKTIHNWAEKGEIRHFRTPGRHLRFRRLDVLDFLQKYGYPVPDALRSGKPKVVVVDDDPNALAAVRKTFGRRFDLTTFADPFDALIAIGALRPDALVIDTRIKGLDALRCVERLKSIAATASIPIVVFSADEQQRRAVMEAGASDFVSKAEIALLREAVERLTSWSTADAYKPSR